jgi:hypothetical protein
MVTVLLAGEDPPQLVAVSCRLTTVCVATAGPLNDYRRIVPKAQLVNSRNVTKSVISDRVVPC